MNKLLTLLANKAGPALTRNVLVAAGTLQDDFETLADYTQSPAASCAADTVNFKTGTQGIKVTGTGTTVSYANKTVNYDWSAASTVSWWVYIDDLSQANSQWNYQIYLSSVSNYAKYMGFGFNSNQFHSGWNKVTLRPSDFNVVSGESWNNTIIAQRTRCISVSGKVLNVTYDDLRINELWRPKVLFTFDDGHASAYDQGYTYLQANGLRATFYIVPTFIDSGAAYMTLANLHTMYTHYHNVANHTYDHTDLTTLSLADQEAEFTNAINYLTTNNMPKYAKHVAYPAGKYNADTLTAFAALGLTTGRTTIESYDSGHITSIPIDDARLLKWAIVANTTTLATAKTYIDNAIALGQAVILGFHKIVTSPSISIEWATADFQALVDYVKVKQSAGLLDVVTMDEFYHG
jgi:peptidoglycan/xylan/chitin deacetylase (PgdA/CDA1 family)